MKEYVPTLNARSKWLTPGRELQPVDLVWLTGESSARGFYPMARVKKLHYGQAAAARSALLQLSDREPVRHVTKLFPVFVAQDSIPHAEHRSKALDCEILEFFILFFCLILP